MWGERERERRGVIPGTFAQAKKKKKEGRAVAPRCFFFSLSIRSARPPLRPTPIPASLMTAHALTHALAGRPLAGGVSTTATPRRGAPLVARASQAPKKKVTLSFEVTQAVPFGQRVAVVGSSPELGAWAEPVPLVWKEGDVWTGSVEGCVFLGFVCVCFVFPSSQRSSQKGGLLLSMCAPAGSAYDSVERGAKSGPGRRERTHLQNLPRRIGARVARRAVGNAPTAPLARPLSHSHSLSLSP